MHMDKIIANLDKVKLKLDEAFFYLDEIEELVEEEAVAEEAGEKVNQASDRLAAELAGLSGKVAELQEILRAVKQQESTPAAGEQEEPSAS